MASALLPLCPGVAQPGWLCLRAWEPQKHHHPQHVLVPLDHSWFIMQPDENKGRSVHNCLQFRHVLYFPSPCIELAKDPSQCMGLNCNWSSQNCKECALFPSAWRRKVGPYLQKFQKNSVVSKIIFIIVLFCFCNKLIHICSS